MQDQHVEPSQDAAQSTSQQTSQPTATPPQAPSAEQNAFTAVGDNTFGQDATQTATQANIPKKYQEYKQLKGILQSVGLAVIGILFSIFLYNAKHDLGIALIFAGFAIGIAIIGSVLSIISFRQLRRSEKENTGKNQFQTGTAVTYQTDAPEAVVNADETVIGWLGPVSRSDKLVVDKQWLMNEQNYAAANTLVFTNKQIIAIMLGPQDAPSDIAGGLLNQAASAAIAYSDEGSLDKDVQFTSLYAHKWEQIMSTLLSAPLSEVGKRHLTYAIPYASIASCEIKRTFINPGIVFHMNDGTARSFTTLRKDLLDQAQVALGQYIRTQ